MATKGETLDLSAQAAEEAQQTRALSNLKKNLSHLLISSQTTEGPEIDFGPDEDGKERVLFFKAQIPTTAMEALIGDDNRIRALKTYIYLSLKPESRPLFDSLMDDLPLDALNAIVEVITEATTPFPTK